MIFDQSLIYFDLLVFPATQVGLVLHYQLKAEAKRACKARGRTPVEAWMGTPDEVDFYPPIYSVRYICFL
jgi:hypothetical protein